LVGGQLLMMWSIVRHLPHGGHLLLIASPSPIFSGRIVCLVWKQTVSDQRRHDRSDPSGQMIMGSSTKEKFTTTANLQLTIIMWHDD